MWHCKKTNILTAEALDRERKSIEKVAGEKRSKGYRKAIKTREEEQRHRTSFLVAYPSPPPHPQPPSHPL
jgi:hypothetical protein